MAPVLLRLLEQEDRSENQIRLLTNDRMRIRLPPPLLPQVTRRIPAFFSLRHCVLASALVRQAAISFSMCGPDKKIISPPSSLPFFPGTTPE